MKLAWALIYINAKKVSLRKEALEVFKEYLHNPQVILALQDRLEIELQSSPLYREMHGLFEQCLYSISK